VIEKNIKINDDGSTKSNKFDNNFKQNFKYIITTLKEVSNRVGQGESIWLNDLKKIDLAKILSTKNSSLKELHCDYGDKNNDFNKYFDICEKYSMSPLSVIHFPMGGYLLAYPSDIAANREFIINKEKNIPRELRNVRKQAKYKTGEKIKS